RGPPRARRRPTAGGERIRQLTLEFVPDAHHAEPPSPPRTATEPSAGRAGLAALYTINADGSNLRAVAVPDGFARAAHPSWSPDGRRIAFAAFDATGRDPLVRVVASEGGPTVAVAAGVAPRWSHDGTRLIYMASGKAEYATDWTAPGRNDERIEAVRLAGPGAGEVEVLARGLWPRPAPNDDRIAFVARLDANWDIYLRSADGTNLIRLTDDPANDTQPVWTADGRAIVFLSDRGNRWDLYLIAVDGRGEVVRLTNHRRREDGADLNPDGTRVAFTDNAIRPDSRILLLDLASGAVRPLTENSQGDRDPAWSPDGRALAFVSRRPTPLVPFSGRQP
ncbi:MAG: PD40 domain-containing protein, partial [Isosphaeraceae bacterium]|nr:PD40 domain-containing protein [Isosphaeraceae bacterium]